MGKSYFIVKPLNFEQVNSWTKKNIINLNFSILKFWNIKINMKIASCQICNWMVSSLPTLLDSFLMSHIKNTFFSSFKRSFDGSLSSLTFMFLSTLIDHVLLINGSHFKYLYARKLGLVLNWTRMVPWWLNSQCEIKWRRKVTSKVTKT